MNHFVTREEFDGVLDRLQDLEDADFMGAVEADSSARDYLPLGAVKRLLAGEHPVTVWRELRGLAGELAEIGVSSYDLATTEARSGAAIAAVGRPRAA